MLPFDYLMHKGFANCWFIYNRDQYTFYNINNARGFQQLQAQGQENSEAGTHT